MLNKLSTTAAMALTSFLFFGCAEMQSLGGRMP